LKATLATTVAADVIPLVKIERREMLDNSVFWDFRLEENEGDVEGVKAEVLVTISERSGIKTAVFMLEFLIKGQKIPAHQSEIKTLERKI
jgi:hypothetical protein